MAIDIGKALSDAGKGAVDIQTGITTGGLSEIGGGGLSGLQNLYGGLTGQNAQEAATEAAQIQAQAQREALAYLMQTEAMPQAFREGALTQLGAYYGIGLTPQLDDMGNPTGQFDFSQIEPTRMSQEALLEQAQTSPFYTAQIAGIEGGREAGEEALARRAAAAGGGLRGGATTSSLIDYNTQLELEKNRALADAFGQQQAQEQQRLAGLGSLAQLPSMAPQIAQQQAGIGQTLAQGVTAGAQAEQQAMGNLLGLAGMLGGAAISGGAPAVSDERLKDDINLIKHTSHPFIPYYEWEWNSEAEKLGKKGKERGYLAQDVEQVWPDLVINGEDGYKRILKDEVEKRLEDKKNG